jgi:prenyltransferase beta subunit
MKRLPLAALFLLLVLPAVRAQTADEKQATVAYLKGLQNTDGGFSATAGPAGSDLRATVSAVRALKYFGGEPRDRDGCVTYVERCFDPQSGGFRAAPPEGTIDVTSTAIGLMGVAALNLPAEKYAGPAVRYLDEHAKTFEEVRLAAAGLEAVNRRSPRAEDWLKQVAEMRNPDGTYGKGDGTARATGSAVVTVLRLGGKVEDRESVLRALRAGQRKDGGFGQEGKAGSDLETTYRVMRCFHMLGEQPDAEACRGFVAKCRNALGGYGVVPGQAPSVAGTYFAGSVLHWLAEK